MIADDLTGACDVGAEFAAAGLPARVAVDAAHTAVDAGVLQVVNTQSRALTTHAAYERVLRVVRGRSTDLLLKKIDSALRGHLGAELEAVLDGSGAIAALVLPAIPAAGRVTRDACQWFGGRPLGATEFARDPEGPGAESSIPAVLARESRRRTETISAAIVRSGGLVDRVRALARAGAAFFVVDAETDADLAGAVAAILE
ncbi:MAG: four-carbon acid sugar kinase family protein, partial [Candidatus Binatia bacterium]